MAFEKQRGMLFRTETKRFIVWALRWQWREIVQVPCSVSLADMVDMWLIVVAGIVHLHNIRSNRTKRCNTDPK
jgi:hypothetical protein